MSMLKTEDLMDENKEIEYSIDKVIESSYNALRRPYRDGFYHPSDLLGFNYGVDDVCLIPDTLIVTQDGYKRAGDVAEGDMVLTHRGRYRKVTKTFRRRAGDVEQVKFIGSPDVFATINHPILARKYHWSNNKRIFEKPTWISLSEIKYALERIENRSSHEDRYLIFNPFRPSVSYTELSDEFCELLGYYQAEGHLSQAYKYNLGHGYKNLDTFTTITFTIGAHERDFSNRIGELSLKLRGKKARIWVSNQDKSMRCVINSVKLASLIHQYCGKYRANQKRFVAKILNLPPNKLRIILMAFIRGDGWVDRVCQNRFKLSTTSEILAHQLHYMAFRCGFNSTISMRINNNHWVINEKVWEISVTLPPQKRHPQVFENYGVWIPIRDMKSVEGTFEVVNFSVEEDESYVTVAGAFHNCLRQAYFKYRADIAYNRELAGVYEQGRLNELQLGNRFLTSLEAGWVILNAQQDITYEIDDPSTPGRTIKFLAHPDFVAIHPPDKTEYVIEVKSVNFHNRSDFLSYVKLPEYPKQPHVLQANFYAWILKKKFQIFYINRGDATTRGFACKPQMPNEGLFNVIIERAKRLDKMLMENTPPSGTVEWYCNFNMRVPKAYCPAFNWCRALGGYEPAPKIYFQCKTHGHINENEVVVNDLGEPICSVCSKRVARYYDKTSKMKQIDNEETSSV